MPKLWTFLFLYAFEIFCCFVCEAFNEPFTYFSVVFCKKRMFMFATFFLWTITMIKIQPCWENLSICICFLESQKRMCLFEIKNRIASQLQHKKISNNLHYTLLKAYVDLEFLELLPEYLHFTFRMCRVFFLSNRNNLLTTNKHCLGFGRNHSRRTGYCAKSPGACPGPDFWSGQSPLHL